MSMSPSIHSEQIREATFALIQMSCGTDPDENREKAIAKIRMAAEQGAQVMVLQELFASQYFCFTEDYDHFSLAETIPGTSTRTFSSSTLSSKLLATSSAIASSTVKLPAPMSSCRL